MSLDPSPSAEPRPPGWLDRLAVERFHRRWYERETWKRMTFLGVPVMKWPGDLWNYQEILTDLRPALVVEFGTYLGGSALWFAETMRSLGIPPRVLTVDVRPDRVHGAVRGRTDIECMASSSVDPSVSTRIAALRAERSGPVFAILDGDHRKDHVLAEMESLRPLLVSGDVLIVEDGNVNGHPVLPEFGPGPLEAIRAYVAAHPGDYERDVARETKFGFTFAPEGYLRRR